MTLTYEQIAEICHEANRAIQKIEGDPTPSSPWVETPAYERESAIEGVINVCSGISAERLHEMWVTARERDGWKLGKIKDPIAKTHPCLIPYCDLAYTQRVKDAVFSAIVRACVEVAE